MGSAGRGGLRHRDDCVTGNGGDGSHGMLGMLDVNIFYLIAPWILQ